MHRNQVECPCSCACMQVAAVSSPEPCPHLRRRNGDAQHRAHHSPVLEDLLHQAPHCTQGTTAGGLSAVCFSSSLVAAHVECPKCKCRRVHGPNHPVKYTSPPPLIRAPPVSMGSAKPMPLLAPFPVGSAMAVLMPASRRNGMQVLPSAYLEQMDDRCGLPCKLIDLQPERSPLTNQPAAAVQQWAACSRAEAMIG